MPETPASSQPPSLFTGFVRIQSSSTISSSPLTESFPVKCTTATYSSPCWAMPRLIVELQDGRFVVLGAALAQGVRDLDEEILRREVGEFDHVARVPGLLELHEFSFATRRKGFAVKSVGA